MECLAVAVANAMLTDAIHVRLCTISLVFLEIVALIQLRLSSYKIQNPAVRVVLAKIDAAAMLRNVPSPFSIQS